MVIATQTDDALLLLLGELCQTKSIPLLVRAGVSSTLCPAVSHVGFCCRS